MKKLMNLIALSCKKATFLIEKSHGEPLSFMDKVRLSMHLKICDKCAGYQKQSLLIENVLKANHKNLSNPSDLKLSSDARARIQETIDSNLK